MTAVLAEKEYKGKDFEIINGQVYMMSPARFDHAAIAGNIFFLFKKYLWGKKCVPIPDGVKVEVKNKAGNKNSVVPDFMVVCDRDKIKNNKIVGAPDLVVEVISTSTRKKDRTVKKDAYEEMGVKEYWLVEIGAKNIDRYLLIDGKFELENSYAILDQYDIDERDEEGTEMPPSTIKVSLYDDLYIDLEDVFYY